MQAIRIVSDASISFWGLNGQVTGPTNWIVPQLMLFASQTLSSQAHEITVSELEDTTLSVIN